MGIEKQTILVNSGVFADIFCVFKVLDYSVYFAFTLGLYMISLQL